MNPPASKLRPHKRVRSCCVMSNQPIPFSFAFKHLAPFDLAFASFSPLTGHLDGLNDHVGAANHETAHRLVESGLFDPRKWLKRSLLRVEGVGVGKPPTAGAAARSD